MYYEKNLRKYLFKKININSNDILFVIDMQNDFIPDSPDSKKEGAFSVVEGDEIIRPIAKLIKNIKCKIIASRDYHPKEYCSFKNFPPHCLWNSVGSKFAKPIERELLKKKDDVVIGFKGFHKIADSFGAITYKKKYAKERKELCYNNKYKCCQNINLTGSFILDTSSKKVKISGYPSNFKNKIDKCTKLTVNHKPDACIITNLLNYINYLQSLNKTKNNNNLFICGLAADYCVLDTAINLIHSNYKNIYIIYDLTRYAWTDEKNVIDALNMKKDHVEFNKGYFFTKIDNISKKYIKNNIKLISINNLIL